MGKGFQENQIRLLARNVIKECGLSKPPICDEIVAEHLGLRVLPVTRERVANLISGTDLDPDCIESFRAAPAVLWREPGIQPTVFIFEQSKPERARMSVFHECGHALLPWHHGHNYLCAEDDIHNNANKKVLERQAYICGTELMMPSEMFVEDALSLDTSIASISRLGERYCASLEATAIRYCITHPGARAMVMVEPSNNMEASSVVAQEDEGSETALCFFKMPPKEEPQEPDPSPLKVKYFVSSQRFPSFFFKSGQSIGEDNLVYELWESGIKGVGDVHASAFGSSANMKFKAECLPLGFQRRILVLLWLSDNQLLFNL